MRYTFQPYEKTPLMREHLCLGGTNPQGGSIQVNNLYLERDGRPWIPVMGEYHFTRSSRDQWYRELCKMKAGGVTLVATYLLWIYHEEEEGGLILPATEIFGLFCWNASEPGWRR